MSIFLDTSALYAVLDADDPNHDAAVRTYEALVGTEGLITHNYVHVEAEALVRHRLGAHAATRLLGELLPAVTTVWVDAAIHEAAVEAIADEGRGRSLVDEVSFVVMRSLRIDTALAYDTDFEREGFGFPRLPDPRRHSISEVAAPYGTPSEPDDLVSVAELASRSGRSINTIQSWRRRHADFPAPRVELAAGPIWIWNDVEAWIHGRSRRRQPAAGS